MTKEELEEFKNKLDRIKDSFPPGLLQEEPRYQLTGEIIPPEKRKSEDSSSKG